MIDFDNARKVIEADECKPKPDQPIMCATHRELLAFGGEGPCLRHSEVADVAAELLAAVEQLREEVAELRAQAAADGALMHAWHRESETAADERDELAVLVETLRGSMAKARGEHIGALTERDHMACITCLRVWPCPTFRALEGTDDAE